MGQILLVNPFKVLEVLLLGEVCSAFLPSKKACWAHQFRYLGVGQQYREVSFTVPMRPLTTGTGKIMLECGQIIRKIADQRRSAIRTGPSGSDNGDYVNFAGLDIPGVMAF